MKIITQNGDNDHLGVKLEEAEKAIFKFRKGGIGAKSNAWFKGQS